MRHFEPDHGHPDAFARNGFLQPDGDAARELQKAGIPIFVHVENLIDFLFRDAERVAFRIWVDVQECEVIFVFRDFVGRDFARDDFGENGWHDIYL